MSKKSKKKNNKRNNTAKQPSIQAVPAISAPAAASSAPSKDSVPVKENEYREAAKPVPAKSGNENNAAKKPAAAPKKEAAQQESFPGSPVLTDHTKPLPDRFKPFLPVLLCLFLILILLLLFVLQRRDLENAKKLNASLQNALLSASENLAALNEENSEQQRKIDALSTALNARTESEANEKKEAEELSVPSQYPLRGIATIAEAAANGNNNSNEEDDKKEDHSLHFSMNEGSLAIAAGNGVVSSVEEEENGGYTILLDHGNGYTTRYVGDGMVLVAEGDEVSRGMSLMIYGSDGGFFTYSIQQDDKDIDPMSIMEIDG